MLGLIFGVGVWLKSAFSAILALIVKYPALAACVALLCVSAWLWNGWNGAEKRVDAELAQNAQIIAASEEAERLAIAAREATEARYRSIANAIDKEHSAALADARDATDAYIVRMRAKAGSCPSGSAAATSQGGNTSVPQTAPAAAVMVAEADVRICGDLYSYANAAHDWASSLNP